MPDSQEAPEQATLDAITVELDAIMDLLNDPAALRHRADKVEREAVAIPRGHVGANPPRT